MDSYLLFAADRSEDRTHYWRPYERGYTADVDAAGRYPRARAQQLECVTNRGEETIAVPFVVAMQGESAVRAFVRIRIDELRAVSAR